MKSNMITKMITMCMCMMVVGFAKQNVHEPITITLEQNTVVVAEKPNPDQEKIDYYNLESHNGSTIADWTDADYISELPAEKAAAWGTNEYVPAGRDSEHTIEVCSDYYSSEGSWALWASTSGQGSPGEYITDDQFFSASYECVALTLTLAPGWYAVDSFDSYGDGGQDIYADGAYVGSMCNSCSFSETFFELEDLPVPGCTDSSACNYDSNATNNDGSCEYAQGSCNCNGNPTGNYCDCNYNVDDECGVCDGDGSSCSGSVILSFSSIDGSAGTAEIYMQNDVAIAGLQFVINDSPNYLNLIDVSGGTAENYNFTLSSSEDGTILGFTLTGTNIPAGSGDLLVATFDNNNTDQIFDLCLSDPVFSDTNANGVSVTLGDCVEMDFSSSLLGDINDDGVINILDVVVLVNIVLGIEDEIPAGDLNSDGVINVLDVVILVNMILGG